jgi:SAM-dependent methyltransferase
MNDRLSDAYERFSARYAEGEIPWDDPLPTPEVIDFIPTIAPGRALDLGCGYGRASIYLASRGWEVDAVDFISQAIEVAKKRSKKAGVSIRFHNASVTELDFLKGPYDFALDIGCGHALDKTGLSQYRDHLYRLLAPGGIFMIFSRMRDNDDEEPEAPKGLVEDRLISLFKKGFELVWSEHSETIVSDGVSWPSAWFRFRRL